MPPGKYGNAYDQLGSTALALHWLMLWRIYLWTRLLQSRSHAIPPLADLIASHSIRGEFQVCVKVLDDGSKLLLLEVSVR